MLFLKQNLAATCSLAMNQSKRYTILSHLNREEFDRFACFALQDFVCDVRKVEVHRR